jgi:hypothetical protein
MLITTHWKIVGVSVEGTGHRKRQVGCQDAYAYHQPASDIFVLACADGAGSARRAAEGARTAVSSACDSVRSALAERVPSTQVEWEALLTGVLQDVRKTLEGMVIADQPSLVGKSELQIKDEDRTNDLRDLATTLTLAVISPGLVAAVQVGDGAIIGLALDADTGGHVRSLTLPDHGEYINETTFVTGPDYLARAQYVYWAREDISGIALLTDGVAALCLDDATGQAHAPFFETLFDFVEHCTDDSLEEELVAFLQTPRVCEVTSDDKTLVVAIAP